MALDWMEFSKLVDGIRDELGYPSPDDERKAADALALYGLLRLCHHGGAVPVPRPSRDRGRHSQEADNGRATNEVFVLLDPAIFGRLASGNVQVAAQLAMRRLNASGLRPKLRMAAATAATGRRLAAALAFPVSWSGTRLLTARLTRPS
jgi:CRISPR-associated protein Csx17